MQEAVSLTINGFKPFSLDSELHDSLKMYKYQGAVLFPVSGELWFNKEERGRVIDFGDEARAIRSSQPFRRARRDCSQLHWHVHCYAG